MRVNYSGKDAASPATDCSILWNDGAGSAQSAQVQCRDVSGPWVALDSPVAIERNTRVYLQMPNASLTGYAFVRDCRVNGESFRIRLEMDGAAENNCSSVESEGSDNYYDFLQISPKAQPETIQRVYRFLAARYHPDNRETGDPQKFLLLNQAYAVLSNTERRARYDATFKHRQEEPSAVFETVDFLDGIEGEVNRRLAVLSLLYRHCRANVHNARVSLLDLEKQMGFPREYLDFAIWYLRTKKFVKQEDNAELSLTALGVDYVEENYTRNPILCKLLNGNGHSAADSREQRAGQEHYRVAGATYMLGAATETAH